MKKIFLLLSFVSIIVFSCSKSNNTVINNTVTVAFQTDKGAYYLTEPITFNNYTSGATSYLWDFGDGTTSTAKSPSHAYNSPGIFTVRLAAGGDISTQDIKIYDGTASYQVVNNSSLNTDMKSFYSSTTSDTIANFLDHGIIKPGKSSDTAFTTRDVLRLGGSTDGGLTTFVVLRSFPITKYSNNLLILDDTTTTRVVTQLESSAIRGKKAFGLSLRNKNSANKPLMTLKKPGQK